jgi:hypothetical protein
MPKSTTSATPRAHSPSAASPSDAQQELALDRHADALFRAAAEACRQHARYARLVWHDAPEAEQRAACQMAELADALLREMIRDYERAASERPGPDEPWWHRANALLLASRDFLRHQGRCDEASRPTRLKTHSVSDLDALTAAYELEASALLALQQAVDGYRKVRPAAELRNNGHHPH